MHEEHTHDHAVEGEHTHSHEHSHTHEHSRADGVTHTHEHTHSHEHPHDHDHLRDGSSSHEHAHTPEEQLVALMKYMVGHNAAHTKELADLASQLEQSGQQSAVEKVKAAVSAFEQGNEKLAEALAELEIK